MGASGRMGKALCRAVLQHADCILVGAVVRPGSPFLGQTIGSIRYTDALAPLLTNADVIVDFTTPENSVACAMAAAEKKIPLVIGTTGLTDAQSAVLREVGRTTALVVSPNTSVGVNLFWHAAEQLAAACGGAYTLRIAETHHVHKKDAPSGTAKHLQYLVAAASRQPAENIPVESHRHGEVIGEHTLTLQGPGDSITLTHRATTRDIFADGALLAAAWLAEKPAGLYSMRDVLGLA